jgi:hypothetical protein
LSRADAIAAIVILTLLGAFRRRCAGAVGARRRHSEPPPLTPPPSMPLTLPEAEFEAIRTLLMATQRGRRFLAEFARRQRDADIARVLAAAERIEACARGGESERARRRLEADRAAEVVRQLAEVLRDLRPLADARLRARALDSARATKTSGLERRFAGLVELDEQDAEIGLTQFG